MRDIYLSLNGIYYRRSVKGFSRIFSPLTRLTKNRVKFVWTEECEESF